MTFEAERQAFYDNEQHLKSRIQSLSEALKRAEEVAKEHSEPHYNEEVQLQEAPSIPSISQHDLNDPENEPAEMTTLKLELSTLATSHSSLQSTLVLLQTQLMDLKRVNNELQEENESFIILLREKTLNGQFDLMRQVGTSNTTSEDDAEDRFDHVEQHTDVGGSHSINRGILDRVDEEGGGVEGSPDGGISSSSDLEKSRLSQHSSRQNRKRTSSITETRGESLADLPITGPGLDLAAELGRAENKDMLEAPVNLEEPGSYNGRSRRNKKAHKVSGSADDSHLDPTVSAEMETMRSEIKSLKDANKALSLYASKIIDRIIAQEGYEHVLAADYEKTPQTLSASTLPKSGTMTLPETNSKARSQSQSVSTQSSSLAEFGVKSPSLGVSTRPPAPNSKANHRSLSFDWKSISPFSNFNEKKPELRPLTLKPGSTTLSNARKLDKEEDDEDRQERERLNATMKLMGIQPTPQSPMPTVTPLTAPIERSQSDTAPTTTTNRRFSFFGFGQNKSTDTNSDSPSNHTNNDGSFGTSTSMSLTQEALEHAEAQNSLAVLDAHERKLSIELARGGNSGFTEIAPRHGRRSKRSTGGSGSTVWSAGMSTGDE